MRIATVACPSCTWRDSIKPSWSTDSSSSGSRTRCYRSRMIARSGTSDGSRDCASLGMRTTSIARAAGAQPGVGRAHGGLLDRAPIADDKVGAALAQHLPAELFRAQLADKVNDGVRAAFGDVSHR